MPPVFEATEHPFDAIKAFVSALVVFDDLATRLTSGDAGGDIPVYQGFCEPTRLVTAVGEQPFSVWQAAQQSCCAV